MTRNGREALIAYSTGNFVSNQKEWKKALGNCYKLDSLALVFNCCGCRFGRVPRLVSRSRQEGVGARSQLSPNDHDQRSGMKKLNFFYIFLFLLKGTLKLVSLPRTPQYK